MDPHARYQSPLTSRYASPEMAANFSDNKRFSTWRKLWLNLAIAEKELGLDIPEGAIEEMKEHIVRPYDQVHLLSLSLSRSRFYFCPFKHVQVSLNDNAMGMVLTILLFLLL